MVLGFSNIKRKGLAFFPDWSSFNPYQKLLYDAVSGLGVQCRGRQGSDFTFSWIIRNCTNVKFIHLHWLFAIYDSRNKGLDNRKALFFYLKLVLAKALGYRIFWTVHNFMSHEPTNAMLEKRVRMFVAKKADAVIAHCDYARKTIQEHWGVPEQKIRVIPHGSYLGHYPNEVSRRAAREKLGFKDDCFTFLFFGAIRDYKGVKPLINSFREVEAVNPDINLVIAGKPFNKKIEAETLRLAQGENIKCFLKHIPDEDVQYYFNAADAVVLPYQNILTSGAAILALSFGKKVVAPKKGCLPELISGDAGILYEADGGLKDAMCQAAKNADPEGCNKKAFEIADSLRWEKLAREGYLPLVAGV